MSSNKPEETLESEIKAYLVNLEIAIEAAKKRISAGVYDNRPGEHDYWQGAIYAWVGAREQLLFQLRKIYAQNPEMDDVLSDNEEAEETG